MPMSILGKRPTNYFAENVRDSKACGYCHSKAHKGKLTVKMMRQHKCRQKNCPMFEKYEEHEHWKRKEKLKQLKKKGADNDSRRV